MPAASLPAYVETVPDYEVRAGKMHITMGGTVLVMPIDVFMVGCRRGAAAVAAWQSSHREAEVIPIRATS